MQEFTISDATSLIHILIIGPMILYLAIKKEKTPKSITILISIFSICISIIHIYILMNKHEDTKYFLVIPIGGICIVLVHIYLLFMVQLKKIIK